MERRETVVAWQSDWSPYVGQTVTVEGSVERAFLGPAVVSNSNGHHPLYLADHKNWPVDCFDEEGVPKRVRVTGTILKRTDIPAYEHLADAHDPNDPRTWRFLLKDASWTVLD